MRLPLLGLLLLSCGPDLNGLWVGSLDDLTSCSDNTTARRSISAQWTIEDKGKTLTLTPEGGTCGFFTGVESSPTTINLDSKACPDGTAGGLRFTNYFASGTLTVNSTNQLGVEIHESSNAYDSNGAKVGSCDEKTVGLLQRR